MAQPIKSCRRTSGKRLSCVCTRHYILKIVPYTHSSGDVLLFNRRCGSLPPAHALLCFASKFGISGNGRNAWDHAGLVVRDRKTDIPYVLEGNLQGVTMRTYEERLMQGSDFDEVLP